MQYHIERGRSREGLRVLQPELALDSGQVRQERGSLHVATGNVDAYHLHAVVCRRMDGVMARVGYDIKQHPSQKLRERNPNRCSMELRKQIRRKWRAAPVLSPIG